MNFNFLKSKPVDYVNIVYFKNKGKLSSFTLSYRLFVFLKNLVILGVIWIPISVYIISVQLEKRIMSETELSKNRDVILAYQNQIDSLYSKTYSDSSPKMIDDDGNGNDNANTNTSTTVSDSKTQTSNLEPQVPASDSSLDLASVTKNPSTNTSASTTSADTAQPQPQQPSNFPVDIKELKYSYTDNTLDVSFNLTSVIHPGSHKGRLLIVALLDNKDSKDSSGNSFIVYPGNKTVDNFSIKSGETFKVASFKTVSSKFIAPEGKKISSFKIICYSNELASSMERQIVL